MRCLKRREDGGKCVSVAADEKGLIAHVAAKVADGGHAVPLLDAAQLVRGWVQTTGGLGDGTLLAPALPRVVRLCGVCRKAGHRRESCPVLEQEKVARKAVVGKPTPPAKLPPKSTPKKPPSRLKAARCGWCHRSDGSHSSACQRSQRGSRGETGPGGRIRIAIEELVAERKAAAARLAEIDAEMMSVRELLVPSKGGKP